MPTDAPVTYGARRRRPRIAQAATSGDQPASYLNFGRSWWRAQSQAGHNPVIGGNQHACQYKRDDKASGWQRSASQLPGAHRHKNTILGAVGNWRLVRATRHVGRHRHIRTVIHGRRHLGRHGHRGRRHRRQDEADDRENRKELANGHQEFHQETLARRVDSQ
jgi:hypothetical protein